MLWIESSWCVARAHVVSVCGDVRAPALPCPSHQLLPLPLSGAQALGSRRLQEGVSALKWLEENMENECSLGWR